MSPTWRSLMTEASGTFFKDDSRWLMIWVDCTADWLNFAYSMISRCTRALSLIRFSRRLRSSAKRSSISCRAVFATLCISEPRSPVAPSSLGRCRGAKSWRTDSRPFPSTPISTDVPSSARSRAVKKPIFNLPCTGFSLTGRLQTRECDGWDYGCEPGAVLSPQFTAGAADDGDRCVEDGSGRPRAQPLGELFEFCSGAILSPPRQHHIQDLLPIMPDPKDDP